jgi:Ca-activated chloride channel family protein
MVQLPITSDYRMAQSFAKRLSPSLISEQGTDIGKALQMAMLTFSAENEKSRVIVLITDGENHEKDAIEVARKAKEQGVRIYTIGIGTPEGAPIEIDGEFVKDEDGEMVVSKLGEQMLQEIASISEGAYVRSTKQSIGLEEIVAGINAMEKSELTTVRYEEYNEQYQYPLAVALVLLFIEMFVLSRRNHRLRRFNVFSSGEGEDNQ